VAVHLAAVALVVIEQQRRLLPYPVQRTPSRLVVVVHLELVTPHKVVMGQHLFSAQ
jgi:hypothetical protein